MYSLFGDSVLILASNFCVEQMECNIEYQHNDVYLVRRKQDKVMQNDTRFENLANVEYDAV